MGDFLVAEQLVQELPYQAQYMNRELQNVLKYDRIDQTLRKGTASAEAAAEAPDVPKDERCGAQSEKLLKANTNKNV